MTNESIDSQAIFKPNSYPDWVAKWWQWVNSIPTKDNPANDDTGENCAQKQSGPVWFLVGSISKKVERRCEIPSGKGIMFPIINSEISLADDPKKYKNTNDLVEAAKSEMDEVTDLEFHSITGKLNQWKVTRVLTSPYKVTYIPDGIYEVTLPKLRVDSPTETVAVSDGYWIFSEPLIPGDYKFTFHGKIPTFENTVTYVLKVN
jgi:hypothetical protein